MPVRKNRRKTYVFIRRSISRYSAGEVFEFLCIVYCDLRKWHIDPFVRQNHDFVLTKKIVSHKKQVMIPLNMCICEMPKEFLCFQAAPTTNEGIVGNFRAHFLGPKSRYYGNFLYDV
jgi:hypothetical protein